LHCWYLGLQRILGQRGEISDYTAALNTKRASVRAVALERIGRELGDDVVHWVSTVNHPGRQDPCRPMPNLPNPSTFATYRRARPGIRQEGHCLAIQLAIAFSGSMVLRGRNKPGGSAPTRLIGDGSTSLSLSVELVQVRLQAAAQGKQIADDLILVRIVHSGIEIQPREKMGRALYKVSA
jgi:hypothetical protein